jgi:hypothetical protein
MLSSLRRHPEDDRERLGLLEYLHDEAVGQRVRSNAGRHIRNEPTRLNGDAPLASLIEPYPDERTVNLTVAREQRQEAALHKALAKGKVNAKAADKYDEAGNTLGTWMRHIAESRGVAPLPLKTVGPAFIGPLKPSWRRIPTDYVITAEEAAEWLSYHVYSIAYDEAAGEVCAAIHDLVADIEKIINPPIPVRLFAMCPTWFTDEQAMCDKPLRAPEDAVEVYCRSCRSTYKSDFLLRIGQEQLREKPITWEQVIKANKDRPDEYRINERTLRDWKKTSVLKPREVVGGEELYAWADVDKLRAEGVARGARKAKAG